MGETISNVNLYYHVRFKNETELEKFRSMIERNMPDLDLRYVANKDQNERYRARRKELILDYVQRKGKVRISEIYNAKFYNRTYKSLQRDVALLVIEGKLRAYKHQGAGGQFTIVEARF